MFAIPLLVFGMFHFMGAQDMAGMVPIPGGVFWVYLTGLAHFAAAIAIITGKFGQIAALLLAAMLLIFVLSIHLPGVIGAESQEAMMGPMMQLLKDTMLSGAALAFAGMLGKGE